MAGMEHDQTHRLFHLLERVATALEHPPHPPRVREPAYAKRIEEKMADLAQAIIDLQAADQLVVDELVKLAAEVRNAPDTQAAADAIEAEATRLQSAVTDAETPPA